MQVANSSTGATDMCILVKPDRMANRSGLRNSDTGTRDKINRDIHWTPESEKALGSRQILI